MMQPFDGGDFDSRYEDVIAAAIREAGWSHIVSIEILVSIPIQDIESRIGESRLCCRYCLDNPNVWLELGFAIA